jgi:hypothetical protein
VTPFELYILLISAGLIAFTLYRLYVADKDFRLRLRQVRKHQRLVKKAIRAVKANHE